MLVEVQTTGVFLNASLRDRVIRAAMQEAQEDMAREAATRIQRRLGQVLQHPTGFYESQVTADLSSDPPQVHDRGVVYGPWLEGIGSRNATTRFKGYATFRRVAQELQSEVVRITAPRFDRARKVLNR